MCETYKPNRIFQTYCILLSVITKRRRKDRMNKVKRLMISLALVSGIAAAGVPVTVSGATVEEVHLAPVLAAAAINYCKCEDGSAYFYKTVKDKMYSTVNLNVRKNPNIDADVIDTVSVGFEMERIGISSSGWHMIKYKGEQLFVWGDFLSEKKIAKEDIIAPNTFKKLGVVFWNNYRWTWYSERVLPGGGLNIPGRYKDEKGYICDKDGYICLASNDLKKGTLVPTPFGKGGKIYDCGCDNGTLDVYVGW